MGYFSSSFPTAIHILYLFWLGSWWIPVRPRHVSLPSLCCWGNTWHDCLFVPSAMMKCLSVLRLDESQETFLGMCLIVAQASLEATKPPISASRVLGLWVWSTRLSKLYCLWFWRLQNPSSMYQEILYLKRTGLCVFKLKAWCYIFRWLKELTSWKVQMCSLQSLPRGAKDRYNGRATMF